MHELEQLLQDALNKLYDPLYRPPAQLLAYIAGDAGSGCDAFHRALVSLIQELTPTADVPQGARQRRIYELLQCRYVQELTQEETARRLGISARYMRRQQQEAIHLLAQRLWERQWQRAQPVTPPAEAALLLSAQSNLADLATWRDQVRAELTALQNNAPDLVADVQAILQRITTLGGTLAQRHGHAFTSTPPVAGALARVHPAVLRQLLLTTIKIAAQDPPGGQLRLSAGVLADQVQIAVERTPAVVIDNAQLELVREIIALFDGTVTTQSNQERTLITLTVALAHRVKVLVVDDNADVVHFYRRFVDGAPYQLIHLNQSHELPATLRQVQPDVIVLDILLPDADGWDLLVALRQSGGTRVIPVIVCSVLGNDELAEELGAAYLPKPVCRQTFLNALRRAVIIGQQER